MEKLLIEWNQKNAPPLRDNYIRTHVRWYQGRLRAGQKKLMPPSCAKEGYYVSIGVCHPDNMIAMEKADVKKRKHKSKGKGKGRKPKPIYI